MSQQRTLKVELIFSLKDLKPTTIKPFADFEGPVKHFAQSFGDPWIRKTSDPAKPQNFFPEKSSSLLLPPILPNNDFGRDEDFKSSDPFSVGSASKNPTPPPDNILSILGTSDPANPMSGSRFPHFPVNSNPDVDENPVDVNQLWTNPGLAENPRSTNPPPIQNLNSNQDFFSNFEFANPSLNNWKRAAIKDKSTTSENNPHLDDPTLDDPILDDPILNDPLLDDPELEELLLNDPKLANQLLLSDDPDLGQGVVNSNQNVLGLRSSTAILKQNIMELDRALLNLQKPQVSLKCLGQFFAHSVHIKLASPQAAQLSLHFCWKVED